MRSIITIILTAVLLGGALKASGAGPTAQPTDNDRKIAALQNRLRNTKTPADSVRILYDIYDLSSEKAKPAVGKDIYIVAKRAGNVKAQLDILRMNSNYYNDEKDLIRLQQLALSQPRSREQMETALFLKMRILSRTTRHLSQEEQIRRLSKLIQQIKNTPTKKQHPYDRLYNLYAVTCYLRHNSDSKLMTQYLDTLVSLVQKPDYQLYALHNMVYSEAARIYTDSRMYPQAIAADRHLLKVIDKLENLYHSRGRKYRDFAISRYVVYRRMLRNYKGLTPAEIEDLYKKVQQLAAKNPDIADDMRLPSSVQAYYLMARNKYAEAIPLIKESLEIEKSLPRVRQLYEMLQTAARQTGDSATLLSSMSAYSDIVQKLDSVNAAEKYKELQVAYDVNSLQERYSRIQLEKAQNESASLRQQMLIALGAWLVVAALLVVLLVYWSRYRTNLNHLSDFAKRIARQRNILKDNRFSEYDDVACEPEKLLQTRDTRKLMRSILSDILYMSALGHDVRQRNITTISMQRILNETERLNARHRSEDCSLHINMPEKDFNITTDPECLVYILTHICDFAQSHSDKCDAEIDIMRLDDSKAFHIRVEHSGNRIVRGCEHSLFRNFVDWDEISTREDSATFICRLIAFLQQCTISYNPHVAGPPQLILTVPVNMNK